MTAPELFDMLKDIISIRIPRVGDDNFDRYEDSTDDISIRIPRVGDDSKSIQKRGFCFVSLR